MKHLSNMIPEAAGLALLHSAPSRTDITVALARSVAKLAPLWTLEHFVAVNPFVGLSELSFDAAAITLARTAGARLTMPRSFYVDACASAEIDERELADALTQVSTAGAEPPPSLSELLESSASWEPARELVATVADVTASVTGEDWSARVVDSISSWAASYFDGGQAAWPSPWRELSPFAAWRAEAALDRGPEALGLAGFRSIVASLPSDPIDAASWAITRLGLSSFELDTQLHRLLMSVAGWAGYARYRSWSAISSGERDELTSELLCVRLVWDAILLEALGERGVPRAWQERRRVGSGAAAIDTRALELDLALHGAYERSVQRQLFARLEGPVGDRPVNRFAQAVFCIDVRSEPLRRTLEDLDPGIETRGFAGFFGVAVEYVGLGQQHGGAQCPVLIEPSVVVGETLAGADEPDLAQAHAGVRLREAGSRVWSSFKQAAVASFGFVETAGLGYAAALVRDSLAIATPASRSDAQADPRIRPDLGVSEHAGRQHGIELSQRIEIATNMLRTMSMTRDFAPLVALFGHESTTVNNPHATGLDCGACGGHSGAANARIAAAILNDPKVRDALRERQIEIPETTYFVAGVHNTTTDHCAVFDDDEVPNSHRWELRRLRTRLESAGRRMRAERAPSLGIDPANCDEAVLARSLDWSQLRPEWGLAGCSAFIIAPRRRTRGIDLGGRVFLHDYEWRHDAEFSVLETIMTAPMIVASWISLQYYASTVDNQAFGCGTKLLHNVVGQLGVLEGRGGDLRSGLPWQSVHDGERLVHQPVRLSVIIDAPIQAITAVIRKHASVRALLDNGWLHLFALDESGAVAHRYAGQLDWAPA